MASESNARPQAVAAEVEVSMVAAAHRFYGEEISHISIPPVTTDHEHVRIDCLSSRPSCLPDELQSRGCGST